MAKEIQKFSIDKKLSKSYFKHKQVYGKLLIILAFAWAAIRFSIFLFGKEAVNNTQPKPNDPTCEVVCASEIATILVNYSLIFTAVVLIFGLIRLYRYKVVNPRNAKLLETTEPQYLDKLNEALIPYNVYVPKTAKTHVKSRKTIKHEVYSPLGEKTTIKINSKTGKAKLAKTL